MNPDLKIVQNILYVYSMETFIYSCLNTACREQDHNKILTLGPLCIALAVILQKAESKRPYDNE